MNQEHTSRRTRQLLWLIGLPLAMLLAGIWQWSRVPTAGSIDAQRAEYQAMIAELDAIQARDRRSIAFVTDENGKKVPVSLLKSRAENAIKELDASGLNDTSRRLQKPLAGATIALSLAALLWSALGLLQQRRMGAQAMRSRELLLAAFLRGKQLLPSYMVVMVVLLFGAAVTLLVYELMPLLRHQRYSRGDMKLMMAIGIFAVLLLYYGVKVLIDVVRAARRPLASEPLEVMGQIVTRAQAPALWSFVDGVARRAGAGMPGSIVVGLDEGFFVTEHPVRLSNGTDVPAGRVLYLPLPYMAFMNASEVSAVVGHELGHFIGEDTVYSQRFSPIYATAIRHIEAVAGADEQEGSWRSLMTRPATIFGEMFLDSFHEAVRFWSRQRELAADAMGAQVAGAQAVASSLLRITALEPHVNEALAAHWDSGQSVAGGVVGHVRQLVASKGMVDPRQHLQNRQSHPFDTHPELAVRLDAVGMPVSDELLRRAMDPAGGQLLQELGLEAASAAAPQVGAQAAAPVADINAALQTELSDAAASNRQAKIDALSAMVKQARVEQPVHERVTFLMLVSAVFAALLLIGVVLLAGRGNGLPGAAMLAIGLALLAWSFWLFKRGRTPALVARADGLQLFDQATVLPWTAIDDFDFTQTNHTLVVKMKLAPGAPAPEINVSGLRGSYAKGRHQVTVLLLGHTGKRSEQIVQALLDRWRAWHAGEELRRMGVLVQ